MSAKSININGFQQSLILNFEVEQSFYHNEESLQDIFYIFPNDFKICIYDITFVVGEEIIKPILKSKIEAKKIYEEAVKSGRTAIFGTNVDHGMTKFKIGNVQPNVECKVILKMVFTGQMTSEKSFFIKFPIDVYNCGGSCGCLQIGNNSEFLFHLQTDEEEVSEVTSNVNNSNFDESTHLFSIENTLENNENEKSIILTFKMKEDIESLCLISPKESDKFESCALLISPNFSDIESIVSKEFVFVIDCSGSMDGLSIRKASECLNLFIKSLPYNCYFNVIRFGTEYKKLFEDSVLYDEKTSKEAIDLACNLKADLRGTNILSPLKDLFSKKSLHGQRQVFIMTDGEVWDVGKVLNIISLNTNNNRCFTIGIGRGCDAGLVEGMAISSGGKCDFVQEGDSISEKVIPQLECSFLPFFESIEVHIEGNESFEISPFPIPPISANDSGIIFVHSAKKSNLSNGILVTASYANNPVEIIIDEIVESQKFNEDKFGCSSAIFPLFVFTLIQQKQLNEYIKYAEKHIFSTCFLNHSIEAGVIITTRMKKESR